MPLRKNLFSVNSDAKTIKGNQLGFLTGIMYLAPSNISGYEVCHLAALAGCINACLNKAGRGVFDTTQQARIRKTKRFFEDRNNFILDLIFSIESLERKAKKLGLTPLVRLNGTSDLIFEQIPITDKKGNQYKNIFEMFSHITFYDYTKHPTRKNIPKNYDLTFSYSGVQSYAPIVKKAQANSALSRIAVVFDKVENIPASFLDKQVLIGDNSDVRHLDAKNTIVALYAKGRAKKDLSGFVVRP